jgi:hypothetical protein
MTHDVQILTPAANELSTRINIRMRLDRTQTKRLLRDLEKLNSSIVGCDVMQAQLRNVLARRDWIVISIAAESPEAVARHGVNIGIVEARPEKISTRLSPMQKFQRKHGLLRRE